MRIKLPHAPYIAQKIAIDLLNSGFVTLGKGVEPLVALAKEILDQDLQREKALEERVNEVLQQNEDEMEFMQVDRKNMFWLVKKKLAKEYDVILTYEDRFNNIAHLVLEAAWKKGLIDYTVSENRVKNIIYGSIESYIKTYEQLEDVVIAKIDSYKRKLIPGTEEYDIVFERLYEEELRKKGMF